MRDTTEVSRLLASCFDKTSNNRYPAALLNLASLTSYFRLAVIGCKYPHMRW